ncbi:hypothetical protein KC343_g10069 [Hortaea werneckii]|nr:hypothetical protein KC352_g14655 [Hortaea werneckii]KAI7565615.1 hypothetical protein KC317_g6250 [Hortaea werneckii]KAI7607969.1 hypothetical protein KC346_g9823 [Hortaea werneckii]KAI7615613.1 hypothetical protein KC343_g10069 [Hortaea werneckii]KAI7656182.1 hypothetical protein KC319_g9796 [Hortaea werneckii]
MDSHIHHPQPAVQAHNTGFSTDFSTNVNDQLRNWKDPEACQQAPPPFDSIQEPSSNTKAKTFTAQQKRRLLFWSLVAVAIAAFFALALFAIVHWSKCQGKMASPATSSQNEVDGADIVINIGTGEETKVSSTSTPLGSTSTATATVTLTEDTSSSKAGSATVSVTLTASPSLPTMPSRKETMATTSTTSSAIDVEDSEASKAMAERLSSIESKNSAEGAAAKTVPLVTDTITQRDPSVTILSPSPLCSMIDAGGAAYTGVECLKRKT